MLETPDGRSKGAAVVEFKEKEGAERCLTAMHRLPMKDREIVVKEIRVSTTGVARGGGVATSPFLAVLLAHPLRILKFFSGVGTPCDPLFHDPTSRHELLL